MPATTFPHVYERTMRLCEWVEPRSAYRGAMTCLLLSILPSLLSGCVPVRLPPAGHVLSSRVELPDRVPDFIVTGRTTRKDVLATLGEPDGRGADERWWAYSSLFDEGGVAWITPLPNLPFNVNVALVERQLVIKFDASNNVSDATLRVARCPAVTVDLRSVERFGCLPLGDESYSVAELPSEPPIARFERVQFLTPLGRSLPGQAPLGRAFLGVVVLTDRALYMEAVKSVSLDHPALPKLRIPYQSITELRERVDAISGRQTLLQIQTRAGMTYEVLIRTPTPVWEPFGPMARPKELEAFVTQLQERSRVLVARTR